jgi:hypothetical protein
VRLIESFSLVFESELPDEVEGVGLKADEVRVLERCCTARGVLFQSAAKTRKETRRREEPSSTAANHARSWRSLFGGEKPAALESPIVFVRPEGEPDDAGLALDRLLLVARDDLGQGPAVVGGDGLDPARGLDSRAKEALGQAAAAFETELARLKAASSTAAAFTWEGVGFADLAAEADLARLLESLLPAAVRRAEGLRALLRGGRALVVCTHAGDTLALAAAQAEGVRTLPLERAEDGPRVLQALRAAARGEGMVG